jgi:hypothetical protein
MVSIALMGILFLINGIKTGFSFLASLALFVTITGLCVNPLQCDATALTNGSVIQMATEALDQNDTVLTDSPFVGQALIASGIPSITSVNTYPDLERWESVDPSKAYYDIYNRYAYIEIQLQTDEDTWFEEKAADYIVVHLQVNDLSKIGATHYLSKDDMTAYSTDAIQFIPISSSGDWTLYKIESTS